MDKPRRTLALEKLASETLRTHSLRRVVIALVVVAAATFLFTLKHEGKKAQEVIAVKQAATAQERAELNEKIAERLPKQLGGPSQNKDQVALVARVAHAIATKSDASKAGITFTYHLMAEPNSINIYAASGGQIYITTALLNRMQTEGQLASTLAHATAHAMVNDSMAQASTATAAIPVWQHSAEQERAADVLTVKLMSQAGYDPNAFASMLGVLATAYNAKADVTFFITHPNAADRLEAIAAAIRALYPQGVPAVLSK